MVMITQHAESIGLSPKGTTAQLIEMISKFHLPTQSESVDKDQLYQAITMIKDPRKPIEDYFVRKNRSSEDRYDPYRRN